MLNISTKKNFVEEKNMPITILHIFPTNIENQTRLFKEARYVLVTGIAQKVIVIGLWHKNQPQHEYLDFGLHVFRVKTLLRTMLVKGKGFRSPLFRKLLSLYSLIEFSLASFRFVKNEKIDFISCHYVTTLPFCYFLSVLSNAKLIYVPHELETERFGVSGVRKRIDQIIERFFINFPSQIVVVCEPISDWYRSTYRLNNVHVVRNAPESDAVTINRPVEGTFRDFFDIPQGSTLFIYQGLFGVGRGTSQLLEIFSRLDSEKYHLVLMGYGDSISQGKVEEASDRYPNIHYKPAVPRKWITSYTAGADIGIVVSERASLSYQYSLPNKFYEYVHAGLPVIVSDNLTYLTFLIKHHKLGWSIPLHDLEEAILTAADSHLDDYKKRAIEFSATAVWESDAHVYADIYRR